MAITAAIGLVGSLIGGGGGGGGKKSKGGGGGGGGPLSLISNLINQVKG